MIPISCKITIFLYLFVTFLKQIKFSWLICAYHFTRNNGWHMPQGFNYWNTHKPVRSILNHVLSITQQYKEEQHEKHLSNPSSHYGKYEKYGCEMCSPRINYWNTYKPVCFVLSYVLSVTQQYKQKNCIKRISEIHPAITENMENICSSWNARPISRYMKAITPQFQQFRTHFIT